MTWSSFIGSTLVCCSATFHFLIGQLGGLISLQSSQDWLRARARARASTKRP